MSVGPNLQLRRQNADDPYDGQRSVQSIGPSRLQEQRILRELAKVSLALKEAVRQNRLMITPSKRSQWATPLWSVLTGFGFFFLGSLSDVWLQRHAASLAVAILDDALVGIAVFWCCSTSDGESKT